MFYMNENEQKMFTRRLNRSTMFKNHKLAIIWVTEMRIDELFADSDDPVLVNMSVT